MSYSKKTQERKRYQAQTPDDDSSTFQQKPERYSNRTSDKQQRQQRYESTNQYRQGSKNNEYDGSSQEISSSTQDTYGKKKITATFQNQQRKEREQQLALAQNIPSFITQVNRNGQPQQQYFASAEENQEEEDEDDDEQELNKKNSKKRLSLFQRLCNCLKFRKVRIDEPQEMSLNEQKEAEQQESEKEQQVEQPQMNVKPVQQRARGPIQTNVPQVIKPQHPQYSGKKSLVIDLDETLVHSSFTMIPNADFVLQITVQNMPFVVYVKKRAGCEFFLEELSKYYELIIFTASLAEYADPVMDKIDKNRVCSLRLFRENCTLYNGVFVKDMALMNRDLKDIIIIDNSETSFLFQPANAVHIKSYFDDAKDRELYRLIPVLIFLSNSFDVRPVGNWWREFEQNDYVDYRDRRNRLQRLDKIRMLDELGDLRLRDLAQQENESLSEQNSQMQLKDSAAQSPSSSPKSSATPFYRQEKDNEEQQQKSGQDSSRKRGGTKDKKGLVIQLPEIDDTDNLPAARELIQNNDQSELESVRNQLLNNPPSPQSTSITDINPSTRAASILSKGNFKFNEFEDVSKKQKNDDPYNFKTQPDAYEEDSAKYKEMKQIYDDIRYSSNMQNINSPVSKQRFVQLFHSNSTRKRPNNDKASAKNAGLKQDQQQNASANEPHFFTSPKRLLITGIDKHQQDSKQLPLPAVNSQAPSKTESQEESPDELSNKTNDEIPIMKKNIDSSDD